MSIRNISQIAEEAQNCIKENQHFSILPQENGTLSIEQSHEAVSARDEVASTERLIDATIAILKGTDFHESGPEKCHELRKVVEFCSKLLKRLANSHRDNNELSEDFKRLKAKVTAAKCGGIISPDIFEQTAYKDFKQFVESNHIDNKLLALQMQIYPGRFDSAPIIPIAVGDLQGLGSTELSWSDLRKENVTNEETEEVVGYKFFHPTQNEIVFETDINYQLTADYSFNYRGIIKYNSTRSPEIIPFNTRNPEEWGNKYILEVWTALVDLNGEKIQLLFGDHTYMVLKNGVTGTITGFGQFGLTDEMSCVDYVTPLARKKGGLESPDRYMFLPENSHSFHKTEIILSQQEYDKVLRRWQRDKANPDHTVSAVKGNCTSYTVKVIKEELEIDLQSQMGTAGFFIRQLFPTSVQRFLFNSWENTIGQLPVGVQKALYFLPVFYIPQLLLVLFCKLLSFRGYQNRTDFETFDIFFRPWNLYVDHPMRLREHLQKTVPNGILDRNNPQAEE
jgi:hypothetical protein